jgi:serine phosphatase RsbU (regulator of sigma subunit)/anti-sigma regulatory factor (Ser/Thr protein kinase)
MASTPGASRPAAFRLEVPCDLARVRDAAMELSRFLAGEGCDENETMSCQLAFVEACNNAIKYAPAEARPHPIRLEALAADDAIEVRITDHTKGFDWPEQIGLPAPDSESGRGLYLIQSLTHCAGYLRGRDENVLYFSRQRAAPRTKIDGGEEPQIIAQMVEELSSCYESLSAIFRHSAAAQEAGELKVFTRRLLDDLRQIVRADWFLLRLTSANSAELGVFAASDAALELPPLLLPPAHSHPPCAELEAARARRQVWLDTRQPEHAAEPLAPTRPSAQCLIHPFYAGDQLIGTLAIGRNVSPATSAMPTTGASIFTAAQANVIGTLADFLAIQVVNGRRQQDQLRQHAAARELEIASNIQRSLLPHQLPRRPGLSLAAHCDSAREVGGDFYDVLPVSNDSLLLVIADVMGKGVPAAMFAAILRTALRAAPELAAQPGQLLARTNQLLFEELSAVDMFITAQLALVNPRERTLTLANAGHCPLLLCNGAAQPCLALSPEGMPLGVRPDTTFEAQTVALADAFCALLFTDGLTEARAPHGSRYGQKTLEHWFEAAAPKRPSADSLKSDLIAELQRFRGPLALEDDQTFIALTHQSGT